MHRFATAIIATIFVASASVYVYGDLVLDSQINAFNATVVDDRGHSVRVRGKILNVQVLYVFPSAQSPAPDNYDIDWKIKAQSSDGNDVGVYDFSLSDDSDDSDSSEMMDDLLQEMSPLIPVLMPVDSSARNSKKQTSTRTGATTTEKSGVISPALTNLRSGNNSFDKSSPNAAHSGSARVKRNAECEQSQTFEKPKVNETPLNNQSSFQATTKAANTAGNVSNVPSSNITSSNIANTNNNTLNSATNVTTSTMSNMPIVNNNNNATGTTKSNTTATATATATTTKNQTHTGSGNGNTMIPSWMVILVPLFVITAARIE